MSNDLKYFVKIYIHALLCSSGVAPVAAALANISKLQSPTIYIYYLLKMFYLLQFLFYKFWSERNANLYLENREKSLHILC